ncbi:MAG TPA: MauE/DoxX family redox-associated membrane protein [Spirochaetota bacterium]|nr:MauE/DoxX family redox-associated membrane protein [Spirochaetota bacterium]
MAVISSLKPCLTVFLKSRYFFWAARLILGLLFIYAGIIKIINPVDFITDVGNYKILHPSLVNMTAFVLPPLEVLCGLLLLIGKLIKEAALLIAVMMLFFITGFILAKARGLNISCGCFGRSTSIINILDFIRDIGLLLLALRLFFHKEITDL